MRNITKMDTHQLSRQMYDADNESQRVTMVGTEMNISLSHEDNDSVHTVSKMQVIECEAGQVVDTSSAKRMQMFPMIDCKAVILEKELQLHLNDGVNEICVPAIKFESACVVVLQS